MKMTCVLTSVMCSVVLTRIQVYACVADVGWITGHTYVTYGPLLNGGNTRWKEMGPAEIPMESIEIVPLVGATCVIFESLPTFPDAGRYWRMVQELKVTQLYTAPTAIRTLMVIFMTFCFMILAHCWRQAYGDEPVKKWDRSTLRILGSVGEPINPEVRCCSIITCI